MYIHELKLPETDEFTKKFNQCSDLWNKSQDETIDKSIRNKFLNEFFELRQRLELGL
jgi:hypothetical protein